MAYALVVSLEQTLEPFVDSARSKFPNLNLQLGLIHNQLCYVKSFFEKTISLEDSNSVEEVEREIKDVVQNAQDLIESHLSDLFRGGVENWISGFYPELVKVNSKLASLVKELKAKEDHLTGGHENTVGVGDAAAAASSIIDLGRKDVIVGLDEEIMMLKDRLLADPRDLKVICIVGMGGIGKTTLAKQVYLDPITIEHFDVRLFVEVGVEYELEELLLRLLGQLGFKERYQVEAEELGEYLLYKYLKGRRYLIVLDNIWDIEVWDRLRRFFPRDSNGSSVILTTRISNMARDVCSTHDNVVEKQFLDNEKSWELLWRMALSFEEGCPSELENVGKSIAQILGGLPLAIVTIGKLLSRSPRTLESWSAVAQNIHSSIWESDVPAFLSLSYTQLPQHLKACFLYLGLFPPNSRIATALLIKLWVAEGFVEEGGGYNRSSLEEKAGEYLHDLVGRSLVIIDEMRSSGGIKTCRVHKLLLDVCVSKAQHQKLFLIVKEGIESSTESTKDQRRLGIYGDVILGSQESVSGRDRFGNKSHRGDSWTDFVAIFRKIMRRTFVGGANPPFASDIRSLVFICPQSEEALEVNLGFRWLTVLHALSFRFREFPDGVLKLVRLKYLAITYDGRIPSSISRLGNLEILIIHRSQSINSHMFLPLEIWKLQKLSHLECMGFDLPDPSTAAATRHDNVVHLKKLVTLLGVSARTCTESVLARMPNLIKLGIRFELKDHKVESSCFGAVASCLHRLESFKCVGTVMNRGLGSEAAFSLNRLLPYGLIKLSLGGCGFDWWEHMTIISQLPNLQVLRLRQHAFCGTWWAAIECEFVRLKLLVLEDLDLQFWDADTKHFPVLEQLHIRRCSNLIRIPYGIGDIPTLQVIVLDECSDDVIESARIIKEEQQGYGNETLQIRIHSSPHGKAKQTTPYNATSVALDHSTADISRSKDEFAMTASPDSTSETEVKPATAQPLRNEKDNEVPVPLKPISLLEEDEVATSRDATSVAFAQSTAADVSLSLESLDTKVKLTLAPAQCLSNDLLPFKTISMLQEDEESGEFWVYATISSLEKIGAWSYLACRRCFTRLKHDDDAFVCHKCNNYDIRGRLRYNLTIGVSDETGEATFRLWDSEFLKFIAETAYELNQVGELDELPMEIESLGDKKALFKVFVGEEHTKIFTGSYSVTEVIIDLDKFCETYSEN